MIKQGQQFRVESIDELKEAYEHLNFFSSLNNEIHDFKNKKMRYVQRDIFDGFIYLSHYSKNHKTIPNLFKQYKLEIKGIDKALDDLSKEAKKLGFAVDVVFKSSQKWT